MSTIEMHKTAVASVVPEGLSYWIALIGGLWLAVFSVYRVLSINVCAKLLDSIYKKDRDRSLDTRRIRWVRLSAAVALLFSIYFIYRVMAR